MNEPFTFLVCAQLKTSKPLYQMANLCLILLLLPSSPLSNDAAEEPLHSEDDSKERKEDVARRFSFVTQLMLDKGPRPICSFRVAA